MLLALAFLVAGIASLSDFSSSEPLLRKVFNDGTTWQLCADDGALVLARQTVTPKVAGSLTANVETLALIDVHDGRTQLPGMGISMPPSRWRPTFDAEAIGWIHGTLPNGQFAISGVTAASAPGVIFRVTMAWVRVPTAWLFALGFLACLPLLWPLVAQWALRNRPRGFPIDRAATGADGSEGRLTSAAADAKTQAPPAPLPLGPAAPSNPP